MSSVASADILFQEAQSLGLQPEKLTSYGVFTFTLDGNAYYGFDSRTILNDQISSYLALNKHVTRIILERKHLPNIPYFLPENTDEATRFLTEHKRIIIKPTMGTNSQNVSVIDNEKDLREHDLSSTILEKYITGRELRYLVLDDVVIAVHERFFDGLVNDPKTVKRTSYPQAEWDERLVAISRKAAAALGLRFAAVDFKVTAEEEMYILEINSSPGIEWFHHPTDGPAVNVAKLLLEKIIEEITT